MIAWQNPFIRLLLLPFSALYWAITSLRNFLYDQNILKVKHLNAKVISIGNITVGGTGKTPLVETIARRIHGQGKRVVIQSRGYGRRYKKAVIVTDGRDLLATPETAGDEPFLLARHLDGIPIVVGNNRYETASLAIEKFHPHTLILDDAFQHRRLHRDINIVTMDASNPWGNGHLLPAGPLRESRTGLRRADWIVLTRADHPEIAERRSGELKTWTSSPVAFSRHKAVEWVELNTSRVHPLAFIRNQSVMAVAGIGNPVSFFETLKELNINPAAWMKFPDHHWYSERDIQKIRMKASGSKAAAILTTEKDGVRLQSHSGLTLPVYCLRICCTTDDSFMNPILSG